MVRNFFIKNILLMRDMESRKLQSSHHGGVDCLAQRLIN